MYACMYTPHREREREGGRQGGREAGRERERERDVIDAYILYIHVCIHKHICVYTRMTHIMLH